MLLEWIIQTAQINWVAPVVFALRTHDSLCFCVDYQQLSAVRERDFYSISRMDEYTDSLGKATVFSRPYSNSEYLKHKFENEDQHKTVFTAPLGRYRLSQMFLD